MRCRLPSVTPYCLVLLSFVATAGAKPASGETESGLVFQSRRDDGNLVRRVVDRPVFGPQNVSTYLKSRTGGIAANWTGFVESEQPGEYQLHAYVMGEVRITLADKTVLEAATSVPEWVASQPLTLEFDQHPLRIEYRGEWPAAQFSLFWQGPGFALEPIPTRRLFHSTELAEDARDAEGEVLYRALRCGSCHDLPNEPPALVSPALDRLAGNLRRDWLFQWLRADGVDAEGNAAWERRMPYFELSEADAHALTDFLLDTDAAELDLEERNSDQQEIAAGQRLFSSVGCVACHTVADKKPRTPFDGPRLTRVAEKRTPEFFEAWLSDPARLNRKHRMPVFELTAVERRQLSAYLGSLRSTVDRELKRGETNEGRSQGDRGRELYVQRRCHQCHGGVEIEAAQGLTRRMTFPEDRAWNNACWSAERGAGQPVYHLAAQQQRSLRAYLEARVGPATNDTATNDTATT